jgi:hypothetical protein
MNGIARFAFIGLLVVTLTACAAPTQPSPNSIEATSTPIPPSLVAAIPTSTKPYFANALVYDPPEMYDVNVETVQYPTPGGKTETLAMDIFYPTDRQPGKHLPAVIVVNSDINNPAWNKRTLSYYQSWGRLIASNGLIAVAYDTNNKDDLENIIKHIQQNDADLGIDSSRLGFFSSSTSGVLASNVAFQEGREYLKFAVFYYAWIMTPDNFERTEEDAFCKQFGCLGAELPDVKQLRTDLPLLVVRVGRDSTQNIAVIDHFAELATEAGVPLTLLRFDQGIHGFDLFNKTPPGENRDKAIEIIKQTLEFMKEHAYDH